MLHSRTHFVPQASSSSRRPAVDDMKASGGTLCPSASPTGVFACNRILPEVYSGRRQQQQKKTCQTSNRALLTSQPQTCERMCHQARNAGLWRRLRLCCVAQPQLAFSAPLLPCGYTQPIYQQLSALILSMSPMPGRDFNDRSPSADGSPRPSGILQRGFNNNLFFTHVCVTFAAQADHVLKRYTNRWDGGFPGQRLWRVAEASHRTGLQPGCFHSTCYCILPFLGGLNMIGSNSI